ncbi:hypothetical protein BCV00_17300 [Vibrio breoganii]|uniref:galactosyl transferase n=1 Tax=Vibrio breoganii TaxID=553239 RepID=UPI000C83FD67|nr:galactosyl transferase [Vibrio breoganii]PMG02419.1 hypothetical protein BCV00_17300 [Vibrio breoganii]
MKKDIAFVIPIRHQDNAADWAKLMSNLTSTIASLANQSLQDNWKCVLVANEGAKLPNLPSENFIIKRVDFKPNTNYSTKDKTLLYKSVRKDKGLRVVSGMMEVRDYKYFMVIDDDDFINKDICKFISENMDLKYGGWIIGNGYIWEDGSRFMYHTSSFNHQCGSCNIINTNFVTIPESINDIDLDYISKVFGSHVFVEDEVRSKNGKIGTIPFPGAIYRVNSGNNHSGSNHPIRLMFLNRSLLKKPFASLIDLVKMKIITKNALDQYFGNRFL